MKRQFTLTWRWDDNDPSLPNDITALCSWILRSPVPDKLVGVSWNVTDPTELSLRDTDNDSEPTSEPTVTVRR